MPDRDEPPPPRTPGGAADVRALLNRRFALAVTAAAGLALANQALVQPTLLELATDAPVINVAGRQRMLSQRLAKAALTLRGEGNGSRNRAARRGELRETLALWTRSHEGLRAGDAGLGLPGRNSPRVAAAFDDLEPHFAAIRDAAVALAAPTPDPGAVDRRITTILTHERRYLPRMDRVVGLYEAEAGARVSALRRTGWGLTALTLVALAAVGGFVLLPAGRTIGRQVAALREARDRLEERVQDRTAELRRANADLERAGADLRAEHAERLAAEERQRRLLEDLARAARVSTLGETAAGLAHELNQPLGAVANYVEGCAVRVERGDSDSADLLAALRRARDAALRAGAIVSRIRRFAARGPGDRAAVDPARLLAEVAVFVAEDAARRGVRVEVRSAPNLPALLADPVQLQQGLVNFLSNAFEAVAAAAPPDPRVLLAGRAVGGPGGGRVELSVEDNGDGVPPGERDRIFDAFHSGRARGTGMGLAITRSIVEAHGGTVRVDSPVGPGGAGSRFAMTLPAAPRADVPRPAPAAP